MTLDSHHKELRIRITCELAVNRQRYLSPDYVAKGTRLDGEASVLFYHQSGDFIHRDLERAYELEVMASATNSKEMGPWQILAAANVPHRQIHSVYPNLGGSVVRREVNSVLL